jgi:hypothetical protein
MGFPFLISAIFTREGWDPVDTHVSVYQILPKINQTCPEST